MTAKSWSYFIWGLLISLLMGGMIRIVFSPARMQAWVSELAQERQPKFAFEFDRARLTLAPSLPPRLAVEFDGLKIAAKDSCVTNTKIYTDRFLLPVAWDILWSRQLNFDSVTIGNMKIVYLPPECSEQISLPALDEKLVQENAFQKVEKYLAQRWDREVQNTLRYLDSISIDSVRVYNQAESQFLMSFDDIELDLDENSKTAFVDFKWSPGHELAGFKISGVSHFQLEVSSKGMRLQGSGNVLEGRYDFTGDWDPSLGKIISKLEVKDFPAPEIFQFVRHWEITPLPALSLRNEWFRCNSKAYIETSAPKDVRFSNEDCSFYGDYGKVLVPDHKEPLKLEEMYPVSLKLIGFKMEAFNINDSDESDRSFWRYSGHMNGAAFLKEADQLLVKGKINDLVLHLPVFSEMYWSQYFKQVDVLGQIYDNKIMFSLKNMQNREGVVLGELMAVRAFEPDQAPEPDEAVNTLAGIDITWKIQSEKGIKIPESLLARQREIRGFSSVGNGTLIGRHWQALKTQFKFESFELHGAHVQDFEAQLDIENRVGDLQVSIGEVSGMDSRFGLFDQLRTAFGDPKMEEIHMKMRFEDKGRWAVDPMEFRSGGQELSFLGRGFSGTLDDSLLQRKSDSKPIYNISGSVLDPSFEKSF